MQLIGKSTEAHPCVATIGSFDGVHQGHRFVLQQVVSQAHERGLDAVVVTFSNHPKQVLRPDFQPQMLTLTDEKVALLQQTGIDTVALIPFTDELSQMTARDFMQHILKERLHAEVLLIGYDNHFGHDGKGFSDYAAYGRELGIEVLPCQEKTASLRISSTAIRQSLLTGDITTANALLGYPYFLQGEVVQGFHNGRRLGYPTANLQVALCKLIPQNGVYLIDAQQPLDPSCPTHHGMLNIGTRPTLHNGTQRTIEAHLFHFDSNLYGQPLRIRLLHHLRAEREFHTLTELRRQLAQDEAACLALLQDPTAIPFSE